LNTVRIAKEGLIFCNGVKQTTNKYVNTHNIRMATITLSLPDELYLRMKRRKEIKWSEIARRAFEETLERLEETVPAEKFVNPDEISIDVDAINWKESEALEWKRIKDIYMTQTS